MFRKGLSCEDENQLLVDEKLAMAKITGLQTVTYSVHWLLSTITVNFESAKEKEEWKEEIVKSTNVPVSVARFKI